jgi:hypothetical protein
MMWRQMEAERKIGPLKVPGSVLAVNDSIVCIRL